VWAAYGGVTERIAASPAIIDTTLRESARSVECGGIELGGYHLGLMACRLDRAVQSQIKVFDQLVHKPSGLIVNEPVRPL